MGVAYKEENIMNKDAIYHMRKIQKLPDKEKGEIISIIDAFIPNTKEKTSL